MSQREVKCPNCPVCGDAAAFISPAMAQTFCTNEECNVLVWNPWDTAAQNLLDAGYAVIDGELPPKRG